MYQKFQKVCDEGCVEKFELKDVKRTVYRRPTPTVTERKVIIMVLVGRKSKEEAVQDKYTFLGSKGT